MNMRKFVMIVLVMFYGNMWGYALDLKIEKCLGMVGIFHQCHEYDVNFSGKEMIDEKTSRPIKCELPERLETLKDNILAACVRGEKYYDHQCTLYSSPEKNKKLDYSWIIRFGEGTFYFIKNNKNGSLLEFNLDRITQSESGSRASYPLGWQTCLEKTVDNEWINISFPLKELSNA